MYARFLFALAIAASIFTISAASRAAITAQTSVIRVQAMSQAASPFARRSAMVRLPTVEVRPDAKAERAVAQAEANEAEASVALARTRGMLAGARTRVARVSMLIPYYSFGGASARGVE